MMIRTLSTSDEIAEALDTAIETARKVYTDDPTRGFYCATASYRLGDGTHLVTDETEQGIDAPDVFATEAEAYAEYQRRVEDATQAGIVTQESEDFWEDCWEADRY